MKIRIDPKKTNGQEIGTYVGPGVNPWLYRVYVHTVVEGKRVQQTLQIPKHDSVRATQLVANTHVVCLVIDNSLQIVSVQESGGLTELVGDTQRTQGDQSRYPNGRKRTRPNKPLSLFAQLDTVRKSGSLWCPNEIEVPDPKPYHPPDESWPSRKKTYAE
jgi:hypothetical protein